MCCSADLFLGLLAILFPPLPVWVKTGLCSADSIINILLCMLGYLPGLIHSWYIISKFPELYEYESLAPQDAEPGGRVTYVFVAQPPQSERPPQAIPQQQHQHQHQHQLQQQHPRSPTHPNYGTASNPEGSSSAAAAGPSHGGPYDPAPPTYAEAVKGDHKVQTQD